MKGVGKDATKIFDEVHAWVNYEQLLGKCYVGPLRNIATISIGDENASDNPSSTNNEPFKTPILPTKQSQLKPANENAITESIEIIPRFDWIQKTTDLTVIFYTKSMCNPGFSIECMGECEVVVRIFIDRIMHFCSFRFTNPVVWPCSVRMSSETGNMSNVIDQLTFLYANRRNRLQAKLNCVSRKQHRPYGQISACWTDEKLPSLRIALSNTMLSQEYKFRTILMQLF